MSGAFEPSPSSASDTLIRDVRSKRAEFGAFTESAFQDSNEDEVPEEEKEKKDYICLLGNRYIDDEDGLTYKVVYYHLNIYHLINPYDVGYEDLHHEEGLYSWGLYHLQPFYRRKGRQGGAGPDLCPEYCGHDQSVYSSSLRLYDGDDTYSL